DGGPRGLGRLYAANTIGATIGVLGAVYLLLPAIGYSAGALVLAGLVVALAPGALRRGRRRAGS
ncbi:MAG: hypothetical protein KC464_28860, partial [Myxococcales bacterium]|nr:hypothetical protein [Myxococcales bacterium]